MFKLFLLSVLYISFIDAKLYPIAVRLPLNGTAPENGASLWPMPVSLNVERDVFFISKQKLSMKHTDLNRCQLDIVEKLWSHYQNIIFPPKLPYQAPSSTDNQMNLVTFRVDVATPVGKNDDCSKLYYPNIEDPLEESCKMLSL